MILNSTLEAESGNKSYFDMSHQRQQTVQKPTENRHRSGQRLLHKKTTSAARRTLFRKGRALDHLPPPRPNQNKKGDLNESIGK